MSKASRRKESSSDIFTRKNLAIATIFYVLFFIIGFLKGRQVRSAEDFLSVGVSNRVMPVQDVDGHVRLVYICKGTDLAHWDIDKKSIVPTPEGATLFEEVAYREDSRRPPILPITTSEALTFIGGGTGAWTAKDLLAGITKKEEEATVGERLGKYALVITGSVLGLWNGYWYAIHGQQCDSPEVLDALRKSRIWERTALPAFHKQHHLARTFAEREYMSSEEERRKLKSLLDQQERAVFQEGAPLNSDQFALRLGNDFDTSRLRGFMAENYPHVKENSDWFFYLSQTGAVLYLYSWAFVIWQ
jgi:hypothetical protein